MNGRNIDYLNWNGQPNNFENQDCVVLFADDNEWGDVDCINDSKLYFICNHPLKTLNPTTSPTITPSNIPTYQQHIFLLKYQHIHLQIDEV